MAIFQNFQFWQVLTLAALIALAPIFRAIAVVLVVKCVSKELAELAIPLILRPRLSFLRSKKNGNSSRAQAEE